MTVPLQTQFARQVDTAVDGFELVERLAQHADDGIFRIVTVHTRRVEATGLVVGMVDYLDRHGIPTGHLRANERCQGRRLEPEHLHLVDALVRDGDEDVVRPAMKIRIAEIMTCWF